MPRTIWSDNGTNFVGAAKESKNLVSNPALSDYCSHQGIHWKFAAEHAYSPSGRFRRVRSFDPGTFPYRKPLTALPDSSESLRPITMLRRWNLCQKLNNHFWNRWTQEYLITLNRFSKWQKPTQNVQVGDIVCLRDEPTIPTKWPLARTAKVHAPRTRWENPGSYGVYS